MVSGTAPAILGARDKNGTKNPIIGDGDDRFERMHNRGELPRHIRWETTHGVTIDDAGFIYIKHLPAPVFDAVRRLRGLEERETTRLPHLTSLLS